MSVATTNPFALLDDNPSPPSSPPPAPQPPLPSSNKQKPARSGNYYPRGGARSAPKLSQQPQQDDPTPDSQRKCNRPRSRPAPRGSAPRGSAPRGGRRPFDRHSQTGKTDSDKKSHQGWGGDEGNLELKAEEAAANDAANDAVLDPSADAPDSTSHPLSDPPLPKERDTEEDDNTLTLDQYLAQQKDKVIALPKLQPTRPANEGADPSIWKDAVPLSKDEDALSYFVGKAKSAPKARPKKDEKVYIEIEPLSTRPDRPGRGRGRGRGDRARGSGRGRGAPRSPPQFNTPSLDVGDQTAFPSLV